MNGSREGNALRSMVIQFHFPLIAHSLFRFSVPLAMVIEFSRDNPEQVFSLPLSLLPCQLSVCCRVFVGFRRETVCMLDASKASARVLLRCLRSNLLRLNRWKHITARCKITRHALLKIGIILPLSLMRWNFYSHK